MQVQSQPIVIRKCFKNQGFTLVELLIVLAVLGIVTSLAVASYDRYFIKSNRGLAQEHLMDIAQKQQRYFMDNRNYTANLTELGATTPSKVAQYYTITIECCDAAHAGPPKKFTARAVPIAGTKQATDGTLTINQADQKTPSDKW